MVELYLGSHIGSQSSAFQPLAQTTGVDSNRSRSTATIPMAVFLTGSYYPEALVEENRKFFPNGTDFRYYDNAQLLHSAREISYVLGLAGVPGAYEAIQALRPYAFRADLWRYMILWMNGGVYLDAKIIFRESILNWVDLRRDVLAACQDAYWPGHYWTGVLAARPRDPLLLDLIRHVVANVESRSYGPSCRSCHADLAITGPGALTHILSKHAFKPRVDCSFYSTCGIPCSPRERHAYGRGVRYPNGTNPLPRLPVGVTMFLADDSTHKNMRICPSCGSYGILYDKHAVYCDEEAPKAIADPCKDV